LQNIKIFWQFQLYLTWSMVLLFGFYFCLVAKNCMEVSNLENKIWVTFLKYHSNSNISRLIKINLNGGHPKSASLTPLNTDFVYYLSLFNTFTSHHVINWQSLFMLETGNFLLCLTLEYSNITPIHVYRQSVLVYYNVCT